MVLAATKERDGQQKQYLTFWLDEHLMGMNILYLREINRHIDLTPVDLVPKYVRGLMNLRGQIVTVIDLGIRLGLPPREMTRETGCIVLKSFKELSFESQKLLRPEGDKENGSYEGHDLVGLLVDKIADILPVDARQMESASTVQHNKVNARFLESIVKLQKHLLVTLNINEIITLS